MKIWVQCVSTKISQIPHPKNLRICFKLEKPAYRSVLPVAISNWSMIPVWNLLWKWMENAKKWTRGHLNYLQKSGCVSLSCDTQRRRGERTARARLFCVCSTWATCWRIAPNPRWVHSNYGKAACACINYGSQPGQRDSLLFMEPLLLAVQESLEPYTNWNSWYRLLLSKTFQNKVPIRVNVIYFPPTIGKTFSLRHGR